jgi:stearoyl-CoA desaturase (delta-9 desaturase)
LGINTVLSRGAELYKSETQNPETLQKFGHGTPDDWLEHKLYSKFSWQGVALMMIVDLFLFGAIGATVWAVQMLWIPITAAGVINGIGHFWGYRNFNNEDASRNIVPWGILIGGEELHNNHHTYATSAKLSNKWYEFDIGWLYIQMMSAVGLATVKKVPPKPVLSEVRPADQDTLEAIIANRYEVMARYSKSLKKFFTSEVQHMQELAAHLNDARTWLCKGEAQLTTAEKQKLEELIQQNAQLRKMIEMRRDLQALWSRSNASGEQLLGQLRTWCQQAEESGVSNLRDFSIRLRRYS